MNVLLIDNYDSFVYNLYQALGSLGAGVNVVRNDAVDLDQLDAYDGVVVSPGPGDPRDPVRAGVGHTVLKTVGGQRPVLGVCLGHQEIVYVYGGKIRPANTIRHGKRSVIRHFGDDLFDGVPNPFLAGRYHSLVGEVPGSGTELVTLAVSVDDNELMSVRHRRYPVYGVQFHPESVLTRYGSRILSNFLEVCRK